MGIRTNQGYRIVETVRINTSLEVVMAQNETRFGTQYVTWQCENAVDYFWGHYYTDSRQAEADLSQRALEYQRQYRVRLVRDTRPTPRQPTIAQQMKEAQKKVEANRDGHTHKKDAPDRGDR